MKDTVFLDCHCGIPEHRISLKLEVISIDEYPELKLEYYLSTYRSFFKRVVIALKYIFNINHPHFDEWLIKPEEAMMAKTKLEEYIEKYNEWFNKNIKEVK